MILYSGKLPCTLLPVSHWCPQHPNLSVTAPNPPEKKCTITECQSNNAKTLLVVSHCCIKPREPRSVSSMWLAMPGRDADMAVSLAQQGPIIVRAACAVPVSGTPVTANTCKSSVRMPCASSDAVNAAHPALMKANTETQGNPAGSGRATRQHNSTGLLSSLPRLYFFILHETSLLKAS